MGENKCTLTWARGRNRVEHVHHSPSSQFVLESPAHSLTLPNLEVKGSTYACTLYIYLRCEALLKTSKINRQRRPGPALGPILDQLGLMSENFPGGPRE